MSKIAAYRGREPFGPEFLDTARNPEFIEGLKAGGLMGVTRVSILLSRLLQRTGAESYGVAGLPASGGKSPLRESC
jgi:hypothetical protein